MLGKAEAYAEQAGRHGLYMTELLWQVLAAAGYQALGETDRALARLKKAEELAAPDRILSPFVEFHDALGGLDKTALGDGPLYRAILHAGYGYRSGWDKIRARQVRNNLRLLLTEEEQAVALQAARGRTNPAIAEALGIPQTAVRTRLKAAQEKLGLQSREELRKLFPEELN